MLVKSLALIVMILALAVPDAWAAKTEPKTEPKPAAPAAEDAPIALGGAIKAEPGEFEPPPLSVKDFKKIPILQNFLQGGAELYYLGQRSTMEGFLIYKDGKVHVLYLTPDQRHVIFGGMYTAEGENASAQQITEASGKNTQLRGLLIASGEQMRELEKSGLDVGAAAASPGAGILPNEGKPATDNLPGGTSLSPGERLLNDFISAPGVVLGQAGKPLILMLVDPHCPHCKATWKELYEPVTKGQVRVKLLPIGAEGSDNEKHAARLLKVADPLNAWNKFVSGDKASLQGDISDTELSAIKANMAMALNWKIQATPYIVYRAADSRVKVVQGRPEKVATILSDLKQ
jgi:hypothetical protein